MEVVASGQQRIVLECVCPAGRVIVVGLQQIMAAYLLPLSQGLRRNQHVSDAGGEQVEENGFAAADITLD